MNGRQTTAFVLAVGMAWVACTDPSSTPPLPDTLSDLSEGGEYSDQADSPDIQLEDMAVACPDLRIVILTGYSSIATAVEAIKRGACNYLCKPADADDVLTALLSEQADPESLVPEHPMSVDRLQWEHIQRVLTDCGGNVSEAARRLGIHRRSLQRKLAKHPLPR